jgi:hypothetical protein
MTLPSVERVGAQRPRILNRPPAVSSAGQEAVELAASAGLILDDWQAFCLDVALGERADGRWAAFEVGIVVPRQNGKGSILEARELAGLFLFDERLLLHSAHEFKTSKEAFLRIDSLITNADHLRKRVRKVLRSNESHEIVMLDGKRLKFVARSGGSGRGFSGDCVILDEAFNLPIEAMAALLPTLSARPNPQLWYTSSAGMASSTQLRAVRERGIAGANRLAYLEWSAPDGAANDDRDAWVTANPSLGIRITEEFLEQEWSAMAAAPLEHARERLGHWDSENAEAPIPPEVFARVCDPAVKPDGRLTFALDVNPDRSAAAIAVADRDGRVELVEHRPGTSWVTARVVELVGRWSGRVALDSTGPAGSLSADLEAAGVEVSRYNGGKLAAACGAFYDAVADRRVQVRPSPQLTTAVEGARRQAVGDAWRWARKDLTVDVCPLVAVTVAFDAARATPNDVPFVVYG